jgi:hypothetical protein
MEACRSPDLLRKLSRKIHHTPQNNAAGRPVPSSVAIGDSEKAIVLRTVPNGKQCHVFLTHDWRKDEVSGYDNRKRVGALNGEKSGALSLGLMRKR